MLSSITDSYKRMSRYLRRLYLLYQLNTYIAICEPWEKVFLNTLFFSCLSIVLYSSFVYIPAYFSTLVRYLTPTDLPNEESYSQMEMINS